MKKNGVQRISIVSFVCVFILLSAGVAIGDKHTPADVAEIAECPFCGMDRMQWAHSRMLIEYNDGSKTGTCSLRCAAVDLVNNIDKFPEKIYVADYQTKQLIDAESAHWVIGGDKPGVMTKRAKWAFADKAAADAFIQVHGGKPAVMDEAFKAAFVDIYADTRMIREKRRMKREKMKHSQ